jgi:hypothetical protein
LRIKFVINFAVCLALVSVLSSLAVAQQTTPSSSDSSPSAQPQNAPQNQPTDKPSAQDQAPPPAQDQAPPPTQQPSDKEPGKNKTTDSVTPAPSEQGKVAGTSNDRLFYTLPNFLTLQQSKQLPPMSVADKYKVVVLGTFDPVEFPWWGVLAAISQASNGDPAFGQGWGPYAKRYGTTAADSIVENFMVGAIFPSVLRQDPRFYESGNGGFWHRSGYAISRMVITRSDSGHSQFNYSEIFGAATAAAVSTYTYHARSAIVNGKFVGSERVPLNVVSTWGTQLSLDTLTIFVKEFWPDIHRMISPKYRRESSAAKP